MVNIQNSAELVPNFRDGSRHGLVPSGILQGLAMLSWPLADLLDLRSEGPEQRRRVLGAQRDYPRCNRTNDVVSPMKKLPSSLV